MEHHSPRPELRGEWTSVLVVVSVLALEIAVGIGIVGLWSFLLATGRVPEVAAGDRAIWFHIAAEYLLGLTLVTAGLMLAFTEGPGARLLAGVAAGGLVYSTVTSAGYYAQDDRWGPVVAFLVLALLGVAAIAALL